MGYSQARMNHKMVPNQHQPAFRVALLLVGGAFRSKEVNGNEGRDHLCNASSLSAQREATMSYVERVVVPLEEMGAAVDVVMTFPKCATADSAHPNSPNYPVLDTDRNLVVINTFSDPKQTQQQIATARSCPERQICSLLSKKLSKWFWPRSVVIQPTRSVALHDGWLQAHQLLKRRMAVTGVSYDFVLQSRHDLRINRNITTWGANMTKLLFEQSCYDCTHTSGAKGGNCICESTYGVAEEIVRTRKGCMRCAADSMLWIPKRFIPTVTGQLEHDAPTDFAKMGSYGHNFINALTGISLERQQRRSTHVPPSDIGFLVCASAAAAAADQEVCIQTYGDYRPKRPE